MKTLPIIDWNTCLSLAGNKLDLAQEILQELTKNLEHETSVFIQLKNEYKYTELLKRVHKLHGALCYCGLPRIKVIISSLETHLKNNIMFELSSLLDQLQEEVNLLLRHYSNFLKKTE